MCGACAPDGPAACEVQSRLVVHRKDQLVAVLRHEVYLAGFAAVVALDHGQTTALEVVRREVFPEVAGGALHPGSVPAM